MIFDDVKSLELNDEEVTLFKVGDGVLYEKVTDEALQFTFTGESLRQLSSNPLIGEDMKIDYGDGTIESLNGLFNHTYSEEGTYTVKIYGVTKISNGCFVSCDGLDNFIIPNSISDIGQGSFSNITTLTNIVLSSNITIIPSSCFGGDVSLTSINIPSSVTTLDSVCLAGCTSLTSINIPSSVTSIAELSFNGDHNLQEYILNWNSPSTIIPYSTNKFYVGQNTIFTIPNGTTQLYVDAGYPADKLVERINM